MILLNVNDFCLDLGRCRGYEWTRITPFKVRRREKKKKVESHVVLTTHTHTPHILC